MAVSASATAFVTIVVVIAVVALVPTVDAVPAVFVFGDSTFDVGNNNFIPGNRSKANHPFYGVDFADGVPTGRFSNGYNGADFLAKFMGFRQSPPPFLSIENKREVLRGVSFASGGSGILNTTGQNISLSLDTQVAYFKLVGDYLNQIMGDEEAKDYISKSVFMFSTANNDMFAFFQGLGPQNATVRDQFVSSLATTFRGQLEKLYDLGARKFVVIGMSQLGCTPSMRSIDVNGSCSEYLNDLAMQLNNATMDMLSELSGNLKGMRYSLANSYNVISDALTTPSSYGYKEVASACCGGGRLNVAEGCTANATLCSDRKEYIFWDGVHPTQATYRLVATRAYSGSSTYASPINVRELANIRDY